MPNMSYGNPKGPSWLDRMRDSLADRQWRPRWLHMPDFRRRWDRMLDVDVVSGVWAELLGWALSEVAGLDLLDAASCPICGPIS